MQANALHVPYSLGRREAVFSAGVVTLAGAAPALAISARPTFVEAQQDAKEDKTAEKLLKTTSFEELLAKSVKNKEVQIGRPLTSEEIQSMAVKIREMLGMDD